MPMVFGVDGCRSGWFFVGLDGCCAAFGLSPSFAALLEAATPEDLILIDIPIGLPSTEPRRCDAEARRVLGPRRASSVFSVPSRGALAARDYREACLINDRCLGRKLSKQSWAIGPKILEVDAILRGGGPGRARVREIHPEVCFWALNGGRAMAHNKKTAEGAAERLVVLEAAWPRSGDLARRAFEKHRRKGVALDDVLDALAAAVTGNGPEGKLVSLPGSPERDLYGLPMEIVFCAGWERAGLSAPEGGAGSQQASSRRSKDLRTIDFTLFHICGSSGDGGGESDTRMVWQLPPLRARGGGRCPAGQLSRRRR